jgi:hypothetical protein
METKAEIRDLPQYMRQLHAYCIADAQAGVIVPARCVFNKKEEKYYVEYEAFFQNLGEQGTNTAHTTYSWSSNIGVVLQLMIQTDHFEGGEYYSQLTVACD